MPLKKINLPTKRVAMSQEDNDKEVKEVKEVEKTEDELYEEAWNKTLDGEEPESEEEDQEQEETEDQEDEGQETDQEEEDKGEEQEETPEKPSKKSKDDEYREFIESQPNEELKERARKIVQGIKSSDGRASKLQRDLNAKDRLLQQVYSSQNYPQQSAQVNPKSESARQEKPKQQPVELPEKLKALKEKNPAAAEVIEEAMRHAGDSARKELEALIEEKLSPINEKSAQSARQLELAKLEDMAAPLFEKYEVSAIDVMRSEDFQAWLKIKQIEEPYVVKRYEKADNAGDTYLILEKYQREYEIEEARAAAEKQQEEKEEETPNSDTAQADEIKRKRKERLKESVSTKSKQIATNLGDDGEGMNYAERWEYLRKKAEAKNNR